MGYDFVLNKLLAYSPLVANAFRNAYALVVVMYLFAFARGRYTRHFVSALAAQQFVRQKIGAQRQRDKAA